MKWDEEITELDEPEVVLDGDDDDKADEKEAEEE